METVDLDLGEHTYAIHIGAGLLNNAQLLRSTIKGEKVFVVSNETVAALYLETLLASLEGLNVTSLLLADGEQYKTLETLNLIYTGLLENKHNRSTTIVALGGGVVGDTAGFAAATYQRGVEFIQIPTTLLAQVDSSVGGKTAVNHPMGKNMIGAFHQPQAVYIDTDTLKSLPPRELAAGFAEVIKHGALADANYFAWLEENVEALLALDDELIGYAVKRSCEIKAAIVSRDEKELGIRAHLNFGHTFGHAIENHQGYGKWLHGEAVATGMVMAADLSMRLGLITQDIASRIRQLISDFNLPVCPPADLSAAQMIELMRVDKKANDQGIRFVLLESLGCAQVVDGVELSLLHDTLERRDGLCEL